MTSASLDLTLFRARCVGFACERSIDIGVSRIFGSIFGAQLAGKTLLVAGWLYTGSQWRCRECARKWVLLQGTPSEIAEALDARERSHAIDVHAPGVQS